MKKFLAFLVLVCLTVTGAWADITQVALEELISAAEAAYAANNVGLPGANLITANSQFSSNATETREGNLNNLLDGNLNTYWHSSWASEVDRHVHYLQVALSEAISGQIQMTMGRRSGADNDHPVEMSVEYSVDGSEPYTLLDGSMKFETTTGYVTGTFTLPTAAKYLRFFNEESNGSYQRGYWHCSEFQLNKMGASLNETYATEAANMLAALNTAKAITSGATQANIDALQTALNAYKETVIPIYTVIINGATDGKVIYNSTQYGNGETFKAADLDASDLAVLAIDGCYTATVSVTGNIVTVTYIPFPVKYASSYDKIEHWYALNLQCNNKHYAYYSASATPNVQANVTNYQRTPEFAWGFVGNPTDGFVIYNKASGKALYSADNNTSCTVETSGSTFKATLTGWTSSKADGGFCLNVEGQQYVNFQSNQLMHWASNDAGSTFHAIELRENCTVRIVGAPEGVHPTVTYNGIKYGDGDILTILFVEEEDVEMEAINGYLSSLSISDGLITVTYEPVSVLCADDVDVTKCYYIYTERGGLGAASADASKVAKIAVSNIDKHDALQQFAFIKYDDNLYLYNVGAKKFVTQSGALSSSCDYAPVLFTDAGDNTVRLYYNANKNININSGSYVLFDSWTTKDPGNSFRIFIAEDFDQSEIVEELYNANHIYVDGFNDAMSYTQPRECNYTEITYNRTFNNLDWQALYIPFSLNYDEWKDDFDIAEIFNFMHYDDDDDGNFDRVNLVVMKKTSGSTKPNFPYLIRAKNTGDYSRTFNNKTLQPAESNSVDCSSTLYTYTFTGTYAPLNTMYANGYYAMSGGSLQRANSTSVVLKPQRWYMSITARSGGYASVKAQNIKIVVDGEDETEAIEAPSCSSKGENPVAYDLMGRGVKGAVKGISIVNGKKIIN